MRSKVYFTKNISSNKMVEIYKKLNVKLNDKVGVKLHSGEAGNQNFIKPEFLKDIIEYVNGTVIECNTAYPGGRNKTYKHMKLMEKHGWSKYFNVDIIDSKGELRLEIPEGKRIKYNYAGKNLVNYNSLLVISHFKGHPMGGYGGALKNISIGLASSYGKAYIHGAGKPILRWVANHDHFLESMADASKSIMDYEKDKIIFINVMCNISVDCDCCAIAKDPCMKDIGILASTDPVAIDKACIDLIYNSNDPGRDQLVKRIESKNGIYTIECAEALNVGSRNYELINID